MVVGPTITLQLQIFMSISKPLDPRYAFFIIAHLNLPCNATFSLVTLWMICSACLIVAVYNFPKHRYQNEQYVPTLESLII